VSVTGSEISFVIHEKASQFDVTPNRAAHEFANPLHSVVALSTAHSNSIREVGNKFRARDIEGAHRVAPWHNWPRRSVQLK
jgi:hypothetical protein